MLSILRPEFLEEPIECDDPVPGTLCYFNMLPEQICPFVIMDIGRSSVFENPLRIREEFQHRPTRPVLTYGYPLRLTWIVVPSVRYTQLGVNRDRDDYEIIWPDDVYGRLSIRIAYTLGLPVEFPLGRKVHGCDWID